MRKFALLKYFFLTLLCCVMAQMLVLLIPQQWIQENTGRSAEYFFKKNLFPERVAGYRNTTMDYYADTMLLEITYGMDASHPFQSIVYAGNYVLDKVPADVCFYEMVREKKQPNVSYGRYWHGSIVLLRVLLCFLDIRRIHLFLEAILLMAWAAFTAWMVRHREYGIVTGLTAAGAVTGLYRTGFCVEYAAVFLLMFLFLFLFVKYRKDREKLWKLCVMDGVLTCFFDFLTAETVTVTMPLLLVLCAKDQWGDNRPEEGERKDLLFTAGAVCAWGISYASMFAAKWLLCLMFLGKESLLDVAGRTVSYANGERPGALVRNIMMLFTVRRTAGGTAGNVCMGVATVLLLAAVACMAYQRDRDRMLAVLILMGLPYLRYLALPGHSYIHYFFTYRAQMATVFAVVVLFYVRIGQALRVRKPCRD